MIQKIYLLPVKKFIKYISVGSICTTFDYLIYAAFLFIGFNFKFAALLAEVLGVFYNFCAQDKLVFKSTGKNMLIKFSFVYALSYFINIAFLQCFSLFKMNMYLAGGITIPIVAVISFILNERYVFINELA